MLNPKQANIVPAPRVMPALLSDRWGSHRFYSRGWAWQVRLLTIVCMCIAGTGRSPAQNCYTSGDTNPLTLCHSTAGEGLYYATPQYQNNVTYGQAAYNFNPIRTAPGVYHTIFHSGPKKLTDSTNCPLTAIPGAGPGIGYPGLLSRTTNPFPTLMGYVPPEPLYQYLTCVVGDDTQGGVYTATGPSDTGPYTLSNSTSFVLTGQTTIPAATNYYGATSGSSVTTLTAALTANQQYTSLSVNPLPFYVGGATPTVAQNYSTNLTIGTGSSVHNVVLAQVGLNATLASPISQGSFYAILSVQSPGILTALPPGANLSVGSNSVTTSPILAMLTSGLTSGTSYSTLTVQSLPYSIAAGTVLTLGQSPLPGQPIPQQVTVNSLASAGATAISVDSFTANANYPASSTAVLSPAIPAGATEIPVKGFYAASTAAAGTQLMGNGLPLGTTIIPIEPFTPTVTYPAGTQVTLLNDAGGGDGNQMVVAGRYYYPWNDSYYYAYFIGEARVGNNTCPWVGNGGACNSREALQEARTTDFVNWQLLTNKPASMGGPWVNAADINSTYYPVPVKDQNGNPIEGNYPDTYLGARGLLGTINQVYTSADGVHTFRYFYSDHPAPTSANSWQSDLQYYNLYEREASTDNPAAFDSTGNIVWSAPVLVATNVPGSGLISIAKAHGLNRWAIAYPDGNGSNPTTDYHVEYSSDMTGLPHAGWLAPLTHLLNNLPSFTTNYLNIQIGRYYGAGYKSNPDPNNQVKGYEDIIAQPFYMTDRNGNLDSPDNLTPGWQNGGMLTWTDFPYVFDKVTPGGPITRIGAYGGQGYQATFTVSNNAVGDIAVNGDFATQIFTGNPAYDGWTLFDASGGGTNYPATIVVNGLLPNGQVADVGPPNLSGTESVGGSGMYELLTIPSTISSATVSFSYFNQCAAGTSSGDYQTAYVYDLNTQVAKFVIPPACDNSQTWKTATADITSFKGDPTLFYFEAIKVSTSNDSPVAILIGCENDCFTVNIQ